MPPTLMRGLPGEYGNTSTGEKRRRRRSADENFVETLVVADRTMVNEFGSKADLQSYILTLMGVVSNRKMLFLGLSGMYINSDTRPPLSSGRINNFINLSIE